MRVQNAGETVRGMLALGLLAALTLGGCGGSGSSGFEGEAAAITQAMQDGTCVVFEDNTYCGSGAPFPLDVGSGNVGFEDPSAPLTCEQVPAGTTCVTALGFTPAGFPDQTSYLAAWADTAEGPWSFAATTPGSPGGGDPDGREVMAELPTPGATEPPSPLLIAVLVYLDVVPDDVPAEAPELRDFGADVFYVSSELEVEAKPAVGP